MRKTRIFLVLVVLTAAVTAPVVAAPTAAYAVGCYGSSCTGQNPAQMGCGGDASTIDSVTSPQGPTAELRVSGNCRAAWARGNDPEADVIIQGSPNPWGSPIVAEYGVVWRTDVSDWTDMIDFALYVSVCARTFGDPTWHCTGFH